MLRATRIAALAAGFFLMHAPVHAGTLARGSVSVVDAYARAAGTDKATAVRIGKKVFQTQWAAQVLKVYADRAGAHRVAGLMLSGVKFHHPLSRGQFIDESVRIIDQSFVAAPVEEVDLWCVVPISVGKGVIVSGDHAQPSQRTVFTVSVRRGEPAAALTARIDHAAAVYWDTLWAKGAFARG